jgi:hypothetical protein
VLTVLRRALSSRVSVGGLTEIAVWLAGAYVFVGLVWAYFHSDAVQRMEEQLELQLQLPADSNYRLAALGEASVLWPVMTVLPSGGCARQ